ncbi:MAG: HAD-IA family hydrolase [Bdellovibrionales bacterium]|nr:HAD-IA family hydrolase [Bdellovibrionales bacterium]
MESQKMKNISSPGMIIFDHDGTLVNTESSVFKVFPGIKELLVDCKQLGFEFSVWTARSHRSTVESLKSLDLAHFFTEIYGHDDGLSKPHTMGLTQITAGIEKKKVLHIGDSLGDIEGAQNFGIEVIAACWNSLNQVEIFQKKTPYLAKKPSDCRAIIAHKFNVKL